MHGVKTLIAYGNDKLDAILIYVNESKFSQQSIRNIHSDFQPLVCIINDKFDNIQMDESLIISKRKQQK